MGRAPGGTALEHGRAAQRLRAERQRRNIGVRELARRIGISPSLISQIETGKAKPSVSTLYAIVNELGISVDALFRDDDDGDGRVRPRAASHDGAAASNEPLVREDDRRSINLESGVRWQRLTRDADPEVDFLYVVYEVGGASSQFETLMRHPGHEYGYVMSGTLEVSLEFKRYELGPGDSISFASTVPHLLRNVGGEPVHAIWTVVGRRPLLSGGEPG